MAERLEGKVGVVTGAAAGMGRAHAVALAREGADVACVDICRGQPLNKVLGGTEEGLNNLIAEIRSMGRKAIAIHCDVSASAEVKTMAERVVDEFGKIDILVNNAAVTTFNTFPELTEEEWDWVMAVNLKGPFLCCKYVVPHMMAQKYGKIVNIGSVDGRDGQTVNIHYCCSKAGVHMLTDALSKSLADYNINVNCVAPGAIWGTPMLDWALSQFPDNRDLRETYDAFVKNISTFGREITPEDVADAMIFLVSEESRNITGYTFYVDGGQKRLV